MTKDDARDVYRVVANRAERRRQKHNPREKPQPPWTNCDWNTVTAPAKTQTRPAVDP